MLPAEPAAVDVDAPLAEPDAAGPGVDEDDGARSFSFPRPVALLKAFTSGWTSRAGFGFTLALELDVLDGVAAPEPAAARLEGDEDANVCPYRPSFESWAVAGWKLARGL